jgi:hypothetical protein
MPAMQKQQALHCLPAAAPMAWGCRWRCLKRQTLFSHLAVALKAQVCHEYMKRLSVALPAVAGAACPLVPQCQCRALQARLHAHELKGWVWLWLLQWAA